MKAKLYTYKGCSTCGAAAKFLKERGTPFEELPIRETPPSEAELRRMLKEKGGELKKLFNTSGADYRELGLSKKLPSMEPDEALRLLSENGNLIKRPFAIFGSRGTVGFHPAEWEALLSA